jgi:hypothetical protein
MNDRQQGVTVFGLVFFVVMGLFPPWKSIEIVWEKSANSVVLGPATRENQTGYAFLFWPNLGHELSGTSFHGRNEQIDWSCLILQWLMLVAVFVPWYFAVRTPRSKPSAEKNLSQQVVGNDTGHDARDNPGEGHPDHVHDL